MREVEVERSDWPRYFAALSGAAAGARTSIEVLTCAATEYSAAPDSSAPQRGWSLHACTYDIAGEVIEVSLCDPGGGEPGLRFFVSRPREVLSLEGPLDRTVLIRDAAGVRTAVRMRRRPPPRWRTGGTPLRYPGARGRAPGARWS